SWIGGMVFLSLVLVPALKRDAASSQRAALFRAIALRFRAVVWSSVGVLLVALTGSHDFVVGPRVSRLQLVPESDRTAIDRLLIAWSPWLARFSLLLALMILLLAVAVVRT